MRGTRFASLLLSLSLFLSKSEGQSQRLSHVSPISVVDRKAGGHLRYPDHTKKNDIDSANSMECNIAANKSKTSTLPIMSNATSPRILL